MRMIVNAISVFALVGFFILIFVWAVKVAAYDNKELPNNIEDCLIEIEDLSMDNRYYNRIAELCNQIRELNTK